MDKLYDTIIIGAGAAGLMAAGELSAAGQNILVLEARNRLGGRIHSIHDGELVLEAGAEFIHGDSPLTCRLLKEGHIEYYPVAGIMRRSIRGKWKDEEELTEGWGDMMNKMSALKKDVSLRDFLNLYFGGEQYQGLRNSVTRFAEGFDLVNCSQASTMQLFQEWKKEDFEQFRVRGGYGSLIDHLSSKCINQGCELMTGHPVCQIRWTNDKVSVETIQHQVFHSNKVLITIPLALLQDEGLEGSIRFDPPIDPYRRLFREIGFGSSIKLLLAFNEPFWENLHKNMGFILSDQAIPTWWTQAPQKNGLLTGWLSNTVQENDPARKEDLLQSGLESLAGIFQRKTEWLQARLLSSHIFDWQREPFAHGAYSYFMPGTRSALQQLRDPVQNTLFFAGEALYEGDNFGTVEAALCSGKEIAGKIIESGS